MTRISLLLLATLLGTAPAFAQDRDDDDSSAQITSSDIIERAGHALRLSADSARTWHSGLVHLGDWHARLERALLEALGPEDLRRGQTTAADLHQLLEQTPPESPLTDSGRASLELLAELIERLETLEASVRRLGEALDQERAAHQETQEKLAALRQIETEIEQRDNDALEGDPPEDDP